MPHSPLLMPAKAAVCLLLAAMLSIAGPAWAVEPAPQAAQRVAGEGAAIAAERQRLEAQFAVEKARCAERFAATACLEQVRERRRAALAGPLAREHALADAERRNRAVARREAVQHKQRQAAERLPQATQALPPTTPGMAPASSPAPQASPAALPPSRPAPSALARPPATSAAETAAARRAAAARQRQSAIQAEQARITARQTEREQRGRQAMPLPVPGASGVNPVLPSGMSRP